MIFSTWVGASSGGSATPLSSAVAVRVPPLIALGASLRASVPEAAPVGFGVSGSAAMPPVDSTADASAIWPATGSTSFGRGLGSGGISSCFAALTLECTVSSAPQPASAGTSSRKISARRTRSSSSSPRLPWSGRCGCDCDGPRVGSTRLRRVPCLLKHAGYGSNCVIPAPQYPQSQIISSTPIRRASACGLPSESGASSSRARRSASRRSAALVASRCQSIARPSECSEACFLPHFSQR